MKTKLLLIGLLFAFSCSKEKQSVLSVGSGSLSDAGLIENFALWEPPTEAVHIDPNNLNDKLADGTIEHPFSSFREVDWKDNTVYALKRGTISKENQINIKGNGVTLASYGTGERPIIYCIDTSGSAGNRHGIICNWSGIEKTTIRDLEITAPYATSCIRFLQDCLEISIINCKVHDSNWGIRSLNNNGVRIHNTEVFNTKDDGIFIEGNNNIEISNCYVHHVNTNWKPPSTPESEAGGDGVQFSNCNNWHVHHNHIDRRGSGNKFCFISNNPDQDDGIVEFNIMEGPSVTGSGVYFHNGKNLIVRNNFISEQSNSPVYSHATSNKIYGNIFYKNGGPAFASSDAVIFNNTFYKCDLCIQGGNIEASNNVFDSEEGKSIFHVSNLSGSNNLFVTGTPDVGSFNGAPQFVDAENGDFHLLESSACIDKGISIGLEKDLDGIPIPQGEAPDIGAYEFVGN